MKQARETDSRSEMDWADELVRAIERRRRLCSQVQELSRKLYRKTEDLNDCCDEISVLRVKVLIADSREAA